MLRHETLFSGMTDLYGLWDCMHSVYLRGYAEMDIGYWILSGIGMFSFVWFLALSKVQYIERWGQRTLIWRSGWLRTNNCIISESNNHYTSIVSVDLPVVLTNFHFQFFVRGNRHVRHVRGNRAFEMRWRWGP